MYCVAKFLCSPNLRQQIITGFADIVSTATSNLATQQGQTPVTTVDDATLVANAATNINITTIHLVAVGFDAAI
jgi:hypothetical protein